MKQQRGFSLIELIIVTLIILIIAGIAIPRFLRARMAANEASAAGTLKQIGIANAAYSSVYNIGYAGDLASLGPPPGGGGCATVGSTCADLLDSLVSGVSPAAVNPVKSGYQFTYYAENSPPTLAAPNSTYAVVGVPTAPGGTGTSTFCFDNKISIIRDTSGGLTSADFSGCAATWPNGATVSPL